MKLSEIIVEEESFDTDYTDGMENDLYDLLVAAKANNLSTIDTEKFLTQMKSMGYELEVSTLLTQLQDHPMVHDANETEITIDDKVTSVDGEKHDAEKNRDIVRNLAQKATQKDLNK